MNIIFTIIILSVYTIILSIKGGGIPDSLSASVFNLHYKYRWIWTITLFAVCFLAVPTYIEKTSENTQFLAFLAIAGLAFVGAAPLVKFKDNALQFRVHEIGAIVCAVCSQLVLTFNFPLLLSLWIPYLVFGTIVNWSMFKERIFWGEVVCFTNTFIYCLI